MRRFVTLAVLLLGATVAQAQIVNTVAGGGPNNLPATQASLFPSALATDGLGNLYISECNLRSRVFKVDSTGQLTVFAGTGPAAFFGDGGPAANASLNCPSGLAVDSTGTVFIADLGNNRIRRVDGGTGIITTVAGTGTAGFGGDTGPAGSAVLNQPAGLAFDSLGNLFIGDRGNNRVRKISAIGGVITSSSIITTVAGSGVACSPTTGVCGDGVPNGATLAQLNAPRGLGFDGAGNLYISDSGSNRIRRLDTAGTLTTVAGTGTAGSAGDGGQATAAQLNLPYGVALDTLGNLFIADRNPSSSGRIRRVVLSTGVITTLLVATLPEGVAVDGANNLYISNSFSLTVLRRTSAGTLTTVAGNSTTGFSGDGHPATDASLMTPLGMVLDGFGNLFVADTQNHRIRRVDAITGGITTIAGTGAATYNGDNIRATFASLNLPSGLAFDSAGNLFIADQSNRRVRRVVPGAHGVISGAVDEIITTVAGNSTGCPGGASLCGDGGAATSGNLGSPAAIAFDSLGNLFIADAGANRIRRVDAGPDGLVTGASDPNEIITTVAGNGNDCSSSPPTCGDGGPATSASIRQPRGLAVDSSGNLYIEDGRNRIRRVAAGADSKVTGAADEIISNAAGSAGGGSGFSGDGGLATNALLNTPMGLSFDIAGNLYIADQSNNRIRRVDAVGGAITSASKINTVAGNGVFGFGGDGALVTDARLANPTLAWLDAVGNMYIADQSNNRIRRADTSHPVPAVTSLSPSTSVQGTTTFTLTVNGTNLILNSVVRFNGSDRVTTYFSSTQLQAQILASDIAVDGSFPVTVFNPAPGGGLSNSVNLSVLRASTLSITCVPSTVPINSPTTCTATVTDSSPGSPSAPTGTVASWFETHGFPGSFSPTSCTLNPLNASQSACSLTYTPGINSSSNSYQLRATYAGDHGSSTFTTPLGGLTPVRRTESTGVSCTSNPVTAGSPTTCTVTVTDTDIPTAVTPTGTVTLTSNQPTGSFSPAASCVLSGLGASATCSVTYTQSAIANATISANHNPTSPISTNDRNHNGSSGNSIVSVVNPDSTPPVITPNVTGTLGNNGWYVSNVNVSWNVTDAESAVSSMTGCGSSSVSTDTAGVTFTCTATSVGGTASNSVTIKRDLTAPVLTLPGNINTPVTGSGGAVVSFTVAANDALTGLVTPVCSPTSGSTFTVGTTTVNCTATDPAGNSSSGSFTVTITKLDQTITFAAIPAHTFGDASFALGATASSGLAVSYVAGGNCSIAGGTLTITGAGACSVTASQAGNANYNPAANAAQSFNIAKFTPTVNVTSGTFTYDGSAHPASGSVIGAGGANLGAPSFTYNGSSTAPVGAGSYVVVGSFAGDNNYNPASNTATITINKANASVTPNAASKTYGTADPAFMGTLVGFLATDNVAASYSRNPGELVAGSPYTISATLNPAGVLGNYNITYSTANFSIMPAAASVTPAAASKTYGTADPAFTGSLIGFLATDNVTASYSRTAGETVAGSPYTISATLNPAGVLGNYNITYNTAAFTINKADQAINFAALANKTYGDAAFAVSATAGSGLAVNFSSTGNCTNAGAMVTITGAGLCTVTASQGGDSNWNPAADVPQLFNIGKATATVSVTGGTFTYDANSHPATGSVTGLGGANLGTPTFTYNGSSAEPVSAGSYAVLASFAGDSNYNPASNTASITINKADQKITYGAALGDKTYGDPAFSVSASATSGLAVSFSASGNCSVSGNMVTIAGAGSCTITTSQPGGSNWNAALDASQTFNIAKAAATISLSNLSYTFDGTAKSATTTTAPMGLTTVSVTFDGSPTSPSAAGSYAVVATLTNANYDAPNATATLVIGKASQTISFGALANKTFGDAPFAIGASASSGLAVNFNIVSGPATVSGSLITITGAGAVVVRASQAGDGNYNAAANVDQAFAVDKAASSTSLVSSANPSLPGQSVTFTATVSSAAGSPGGSVGIFDGAASLGSVPLIGNSAAYSTSMLAAATTHSITAVFSGDANFHSSTSAAVSQTVIDNVPPAVTVPANISAEATGPSGAAVTFSASANDNLDGPITPTCAPASGSTFALGTTTVTCTATDAAGNHGSAQFSVTVRDTVSPTITITAPVEGGKYVVNVTAIASYSCNDTGSGIASCSGPVPSGANFNLLPVGPHSFTVSATDGAGNPSSSAVHYNVVPAPTATALTSDNNPSLKGVPVKFNAIVSSVAAPSAMISGSVSFMEGATTLSVQPVSGGIATFTTSALALGNHSLTAVYNGDTSFLPSTSASLTETIAPSATLNISFVLHSVEDESRNPKVKTSPVVGAEVHVYAKKDPCTDGQTVTSKPKMWGKIYDGLDGPGGSDPGCPVVSFGNYKAIGTTDASGRTSIIVPPATERPDIDYVVIGATIRIDVPGTVTDPDALYSGKTLDVIPAGTVKNVTLRRLRLFSGKLVPAKDMEEFGSYLAIVEPEYMDWDNPQEFYPFVLEAVGDWTVTTSIAPPEGFVPDTPQLSTSVVDNTTATQFKLIDVGSSWTSLATTHVIQHKGETRIRVSKVPMFNHQPGAMEGTESSRSASSQEVPLEPFHFVGFLSPLENLPETNHAQAGRLMTLEWQIFGPKGEYVTDVKTFASLRSAAVSCDAALESVAAKDFSPNGGTSLHFDEAQHHFVLQWKTERAWSGCRILELALVDGTKHYARFHFETEQ